MSEEQQERPKPSTAGVVYGNVVYWGTIVAATIATIGMVFGFVTEQKYMSYSQVLSKVWEGDSVRSIWESTAGAQPDGHWYMAVLNTGNGLAMFGIALGVFIIIPAMVASAILLLKNKQVFFAVLALIAALITIFAMIP